jgi:hypothetical protein
LIIRVRVVDAARRPIPRAAVYVTLSPRPAPDIAQLTDEGGWAVVPAPVGGDYEIGARSGSLSGLVRVAVRDADVETELVLTQSV